MSTHSVIVKCADEVRQGDYINVDGSARYVSSVSRRGDGNVHLYFYDLRLNKTYRPYEMVEVMIP